MNEPYIIFFDGVCNLCNTSVDFIIRNQKGSPFRFASLQSSRGQGMLSTYGLNKVEYDSIIVKVENKILDKSDAALFIARYLKSPFNVLAYFRFIPKFLRDPIYSLIAQNRYALFGKKDTCRIPSPEERALFAED